MNKAQKLFESVKWQEYEIPKSVLEQVDSEGGQSVRDLRDKENWGYYHFLGAFCKQFKPKQVIELGGAWGTAAMVMATETNGKVYSITLDEPQAFVYVKRDYPNLIKVIGDDLDLNSWPKELDLAKTDVWFIDSLHTKEQLTKELELYKPFFHKGTIVFLDDIYINIGMKEVWDSIPFPKIDLTKKCHYSGWGGFIYE